MSKDKPQLATQEQLGYLDDLRESGETNMYGAGSYLMAAFGIEKKEANAILGNWMDTYSLRHPR